MSTDKATPRPWRVIDSEILEDGSVYPPHIVGGCRDLTICRFYEGDQMAETKDDVRSTRANAAFIVKAVNLFDELVEALEDIHEYWNRTQSETAMYDALWHIIEVAKDMLVKAKEE
jgi:hypothetical protein